MLPLPRTQEGAPDTREQSMHAAEQSDGAAVSIKFQEQLDKKKLLRGREHANPLHFREHAPEQRPRPPRKVAILTRRPAVGNKVNFLNDLAALRTSSASMSGSIGSGPHVGASGPTPTAQRGAHFRSCARKRSHGAEDRAPSGPSVMPVCVTSAGRVIRCAMPDPSLSDKVTNRS